jgi:hypothetical protein
MRGLLPTLSSALLILAVPAHAQDAVQRMQSAIDWIEADSAAAGSLRMDAETVEAFRIEAASSVDETRLPVLIIGSGAKLGSPKFRGQGIAYAVLYAPEGAKLTLLGSSSAIIAPEGVTFAHEGTAFESLGDGADYSFVRFGAAYTLRLTCDEPLKDPRCTKPDYLSGLAESLIVVGGKP